jgi:hypothetical protein
MLGSEGRVSEEGLAEEKVLSKHGAKRYLEV